MIIHKDISTLQKIKKAVVTVGSFDGVHNGHKVILESLKKEALKINAESVVLTFYPHPRKVLGLDVKGLELLNTLTEKEYLLERCGIDHLIEVEFTKEFSLLSSDDFVKLFLCVNFDLKGIVVGYNHHFGHNRQGNFDSLKILGDSYGFDVIEIPQHLISDEKVSSTVIRDYIRKGDVDKAAECLGRDYFFISPISEDGEILCCDDMKLIPPPGDYMVEISNDFRINNPSVIKTKVHIFDDKRLCIERVSNNIFTNNNYTIINFNKKI